MTTPVFLAVDGGNSKTDVVIGTVKGAVLAFLRGPGSSPHALGLAPATRLLADLARAARQAAGMPEGERIVRAAIFLAGADLPVEIDRLQMALDALGLADTSTVDNDTFALLRTGTGAPDAIAVGCGAGINCVGRTADGRTARFPSLGSISGDWGGGQHLASLALWHAARGEDGRGPATRLSATVAAHFGQPTVEDVSSALHLGGLTTDDLAPLCELLFQVADSGDPVAAGVVARQADEIVALTRVTATRLGLLDRAHTVVLGGGVLRADRPLLREPVLAGIGAHSPLATVTVATDPPVVGAALLAIEGLDPSPGAEAALRAAGVEAALRAAGVEAALRAAGAEAALRAALRRRPDPAP